MKKALLLYSFYLIFFCTPKAFSKTEKLIKSVFLTRDTTWSGDILVDGVVKVSPGVTLKILPGTVVRFFYKDEDHDMVGDSGLFLQGKILAIGTASHPIIFTSGKAGTRKAGDWKGINIIASDRRRNVLSNVVIEYADVGIHSHFSTVFLEKAKFINNRRAIYCQEMRLDVVDSEFYYNISGIRCRNLTGVIENSVFSKNLWGMDCRKVILRLRGCVFKENAIYGLRIRDSEAELKDVTFDLNRFGGRFQNSRLVFKRVEAYSNFESGLSFKGGSAELSDSFFGGNGLEGIAGRYTTLNVFRSSFVNNRFGIRCKFASTLDIEDSIFTDNGEGIGVSGEAGGEKSYFNGKKLTFTENGLGCRFTRVGSFILTDSVIKRSGKDGIKAKFSSGVLDRVTVKGCGKDGISISDSDLNLKNSVINSNKSIGIYLLRSKFYVDNLELKGNSTGLEALKSNGILLNSFAVSNTGAGYNFLESDVLLEHGVAQKNDSDGIFIERSTVTMSDFFSKENNGWGLRENSSRLSLKNSNFIKNNKGGLLSEETENSHILNSNFRENLGGGWFCDSCEETYFAYNALSKNGEYGVKIKETMPIIHGNTFLQADVSLSLEIEEDIDVSDNFWGTVDEFEIEKSIHDSSYNFDGGSAQYIPYLKAVPTGNLE